MDIQGSEMEGPKQCLFLYGFIRNHSFVSDNFRTNLARKWMGQSTCPSTERPFSTSYIFEKK